MVENMSHGGMSCRYENKQQNLFEVLPMVGDSRAREKLGEYQVRESGSVFRVPAPVYAGHQMENGWKAGEERFFSSDLTIYLVGLGARKFEPEAFFYVADGACAMRMFGHYAIPPVEGAALRDRERDKFSVGFDGAGVHAAMARGSQ